MRGQSSLYTYQGSYYYVANNSAYKIHYYMVALILISMVGGLVYGVGRMLRTGNRAQKKPLMLRGLSAMVLLALCIFANTTAFFRQPAPIQMPQASVLTCGFFILLGAAVGVYAGSYWLDKRKPMGFWLPVLISVAVTAAMYAGEALMMHGNLYRFGWGWFYDGLPGLVLAPADILVVILSGCVTAPVLGAARKRARWPGRKTMVVTVAFCIFTLLMGAITKIGLYVRDDNILGCYKFYDCVYMNPFSSIRVLDNETLPYLYGFTENEMILADIGSGEIETYSVAYETTPVRAEEFISKSEFSFGMAPNLSRYEERWLRAVISDENGQRFGLYQMDNEIWLAYLGGGAGLWYIYRLETSNQTSMAYLERALAAQAERTDPET